VAYILHVNSVQCVCSISLLYVVDISKNGLCVCSVKVQFNQCVLFCV